MTTHRLSSLDPGLVTIGDTVAAAVLVHHDETVEISSAPATEDGALARAFRLGARYLEQRTEAPDGDVACLAEYALPVTPPPRLLRSPNGTPPGLAGDVAYIVQCDRRAHPEGGLHHAHRRIGEAVVDVSWADQ